MPKIEFSLLIEERSFNILLNNEGFSGAVPMLTTFSKYCFYLIKTQADNYPVSSVCEFSGFHDPNVIKTGFFTFFLPLVKSG